MAGFWRVSGGASMRKLYDQCYKEIDRNAIDYVQLYNAQASGLGVRWSMAHHTILRMGNHQIPSGKQT